VFQAGVIGLVATPATYSFEAAPIVVDGVMYVSGWDGYVWALDATNGTLLWQYKHAIPLDAPLCCGNVNRGVAVAKGKIYVRLRTGTWLPWTRSRERSFGVRSSRTFEQAKARPWHRSS